MNVTVLMASGEADEWLEVADAVDDRGSLIVLGHLPDEVPEDTKTMVLSREIDQGPGVDPMIKSEEFQVMCQYAPGMWIKVEFE